jgi:hypothetical protein
VLLWLSSLRHPQVAEWPRVAGLRMLLAGFALLMLVLTFMPAPMGRHTMAELVREIPEAWHQFFPVHH